MDLPVALSYQAFRSEVRPGNNQQVITMKTRMHCMHKHDVKEANADASFECVSSVLKKRDGFIFMVD